MLLTIVAGARPNFMKIAPIIKAIHRLNREDKGMDYRLVHTGQHYDKKMSGDFFNQLGIPQPHTNLGAGGGTQAEQTSAIMVGFEQELTQNKPTVVFEAGESMRFDDYSIMEGMRGISNILRHFGMIADIDAKNIVRNKTIHLNGRRWLRAPTAGMFIPEITNGSEITKGQILGIVTDTFAKRTKQIKAPFDGYICCVNHQAVVNQGEALFHVGMT